MERSQDSGLPIGHVRNKYLRAIIEAKSKPMIKMDYGVQEVWSRRKAWWKQVLAAKAAEVVKLQSIREDCPQG